jgi:hypothetical protein
MTKNLANRQIALNLYRVYRRNGLSLSDSKERLTAVLFRAPDEYPPDLVDKILTDIERRDNA